MNLYTPLVSGLIFPVQEWLKRHDTLRVRRLLEQTQWWTADQLRQLQLQRLRTLLVDAGEHVPYYRRMFAEHGFDPHAVASVADIQRLPLLTKAEIRATPDDFRHEQAVGLSRFNTGGSSGEPLVFYIGKRRVSHDVAAKWRATRWWGVDIGDRETVVWGSPIELGAQDRVRAWRDRLFRTQLLPAFEMSESRLDGFVAAIRRQRPRMLFGYASALSHIARHAQQRGVAMDDLGINVAFVTSDACGYVLAAELRACGVDFSFTPVLDLDHGSSGVIGDRAFHRDARVATLLAKSLMHGLLLAGMGNCGKHFPGHGFVRADSHVAVPVDKRSLKVILADDALPYGALSTSLAGVMPAHVIYPKVDHRPAGFSPRWLKDILRGQLGFQGAIFSDDLSMEGARHLDGGDLSYAEAAALALDAGCDLVLLCNQSLGSGDAVDELLAGLQQQAAEHHWRPDPDSEQRRLALLPQTPPLTWDELMHQPAYQHALERLP